MNTLATLFSGGGGFEAGASTAGFTPIWGVEHDADVASVYASNFGPHCIVSPVEDVDYSTLQTPYLLHASPSCKKASVANKERGETPEDISAAEATARAIRTLQSPNFSLENVWGYREFESFKIILRALEESGYAFGYWHLNAADYGVPQTRKRLILLASKTHRPRRPAQTHSEHGPSAQTDLFGGEPLKKWEGWYRAIEDLIPTLPESRFADWQLKRLPEELMPFLIRNDNTGQEWGKSYRTKGEPAPSLSTTKGCRAFIVEGTAAGEDNKFNLPVRANDKPIFTVRGSNPLRAFIVDPFNASHENIARDGSQPFFTLTANNGSGRLNPVRAFLAHGTSTMEVRDESEPAACVMATVHGKAAKPRAWLSQGRVVSMTPRALARFQSAPDWYVLPDKNGLACKVIGNMVPGLLARVMCESFGQRREAAA